MRQETPIPLGVARNRRARPERYTFRPLVVVGAGVAVEHLGVSGRNDERVRRSTCLFARLWGPLEGRQAQRSVRVLTGAGHRRVGDRLRRTHPAPQADAVIVAHLVEAQAGQRRKAVRVAGCEVVDRNRTCLVEEHDLRIKHARELIHVPSLRKVRTKGDWALTMASDGTSRTNPRATAA